MRSIKEINDEYSQCVTQLGLKVYALKQLPIEIEQLEEKIFSLIAEHREVEANTPKEESK
jgi:hypothetical protein